MAERWHPCWLRQTPTNTSNNIGNMALPNSPERYGIEISHPDPMMASFGLRSTRRITHLTSQPTHLRSAAKKRSRGAASVKKRPTWLHAAIEFKRDPFTSGYCYSFKDRTTSEEFSGFFLCLVKFACRPDIFGRVIQHIKWSSRKGSLIYFHGNREDRTS